MKRSAVILKYYTREDRFGDRVTVAEAVDVTSGAVLAAYSLEMMAAWLRRHGYRWRYGSNGIWDKAA